MTHSNAATEAHSDKFRGLIEAQERERERIGRLLHDDINQRLALLAMKMTELQQSPPKSEVKLRGRIADCLDMVVEVSTAIADLSLNLDYSKLRHIGIAAAFRSFCKEVSKRENVNIIYTHENVPLSASDALSLCLFRVLQEALRNRIRHSRVREFRVHVSSTSHNIDLVISDSGVGFLPESVTQTAGLGLFSMRLRVGLMKGTCLVDSEPGRGTTVHACLPLV